MHAGAGLRVLFMGPAGITVPVLRMKFARFYAGVSTRCAVAMSSSPVLMTSGSSRHGNETGISPRKRFASTRPVDFFGAGWSYLRYLSSLTSSMGRAFGMAVRQETLYGRGIRARASFE
jgi:hypothetical protein